MGPQPSDSSLLHHHRATPKGLPPIGLQCALPALCPATCCPHPVFDRRQVQGRRLILPRRCPPCRPPPAAAPEPSAPPPTHPIEPNPIQDGAVSVIGDGQPTGSLRNGAVAVRWGATGLVFVQADGTPKVCSTATSTPQHRLERVWALVAHVTPSTPPMSTSLIHFPHLTTPPTVVTSALTRPPPTLLLSPDAVQHVGPAGVGLRLRGRVTAGSASTVASVRVPRQLLALSDGDAGADRR